MHTSPGTPTCSDSRSINPLNWPLNWKNKLWHSYNDFLSSKFGEKIYKVTVSAGFTCPTRDGTKGSAGCAFCDERGSASFYSSNNAARAIHDQINTTLPFIKKRFGAKKFLAYFQSFTNTYGPLSYLQTVYDSALSHPEIIGLVIGTRPDCIPNSVLSLLSQYGRSRFVSLELGLQSFREDTLLFYERGHSVQEGIDGIQRAMQFPNLHVAVHLMFGAPGETLQDAIEAAKQINKLNVHAVKIHQLMILKDTTLAQRYEKNPWPLFSVTEYNDLVIAFLEHLNPAIQIERTHGLSSHPKELVGPKWSAVRFDPLMQLQKKMRDCGHFQGRLFSNVRTHSTI